MYNINQVNQFTPESRGRGKMGSFRQTLETLGEGQTFSLSGLSKSQLKSKAVAISTIGKQLSRKFSAKSVSKDENGTITVQFSRLS